MLSKLSTIESTKLYQDNQSTIEFHMKRLRAYFSQTNANEELLELDFDVSIKKLKAILNQ